MAAYHIVLDFEMNPVPYWIRNRSGGLGREIVEIGAVKIDNQTGQIIDRYTRLVRPQFNRRIEPAIVELTGITCQDVKNRSFFDEAMADFTRWLGSVPTVVYSWSLNDLHQLKQECAAKGVLFPKALSHWVDFQKQYPCVLGIPGAPCMSLKKAACQVGIPVQKGTFHRALYDAEITAKLIQLSQTGMYQFNSYRIRPAVAAGIHDMTYSIGEVCSEPLGVLLRRLAVVEEKERERYDLPGNSAPIKSIRMRDPEHFTSASVGFRI